ncbi:MAG: hypothetical protein Q8R96_03520 [Bacteroidota bacterium]|nr:hypothetical protein [Bacteroidota bacterium]
MTSIEYAPFGWDKTYRYVITREKKGDKQGNLFTGDEFTYRAIMTNNREMTDLEVVAFLKFMQRRSFDYRRLLYDGSILFPRI